MKTSILKTDVATLRNATKALLRVIERSNTRPILACVRIEQGPNGPEMSATDLDIELAVDLAGATLDGEAFLLPAASLGKVLDGENAGQQVTITMTHPDGESGQAVLIVGELEVTLESLPQEDFPIMAAMKDPAAPYQISGETFKTMAKALLMSVSTEQHRYYLCGCYFGADRLAGKGAAVVSTDGHRMTHMPLPWVWVGTDPEGIIVPTKTMKMAHDMTQGRDETITFQTQTKDATKVCIEGPDWRMISKVIDGTFPDYSHVMSRDNFAGETVADAAEVKAAALKIKKLSDYRLTSVCVNFPEQYMDRQTTGDTKKIAINLKKTRYTAGYGCDAPLFGVNAPYLADAMTSIALLSDAAVFAVQSSSDPIRVRPAGRESDMTIVLMPMRL